MSGIKRSAEDLDADKEDLQSSSPPTKKVSREPVPGDLQDVQTATWSKWSTVKNFKVDPGDREWWKSTVVYEVYARSFYDSNGDGVGDLKGLESKLDYFVDIGVETIWLSPVYTSPMKDFGYDISNFTDIDPIFGSLEDFKDLMTAMKEKNLKLVMDFVPNHTSDQHDWFLKSCNRVEPYNDYYVWKPSKGLDEHGKPIPPNNWVSVFGGPMWEWNSKRNEFYLHQFTREQPDLNFKNPLVINDIKDVLRFWLDLGVDGFRMDAVAHLFEDPEFRDEPPAAKASAELSVDEYAFWNHPYTSNLPEVLGFLREMRTVLDEYESKDGHSRLMMTEAYLSCKDLLKYYGTKDNPIAHFPFNFDLISNLKAGFTAVDIFKIVTDWIENAEDGKWPNWVLGNHDIPRVSSRFGPKFIDLLHIVTQLLPGTSVTYYGEEIGMENLTLSWEQTVDPAGRNAGVEKFEQYSRDPERTPMQWNDKQQAGFTTADSSWLPVNPNFKFINVKISQEASESHLKNFKKLVQARRTKAFMSGQLEIKVSSDQNVLAFSRVAKDDDTGFLAVINFGGKTVKVNAADFQFVPPNLTLYVKSSFSTLLAQNQSVADSSSIILSPHSGHVYQFVPVID